MSVAHVAIDEARIFVGLPDGVTFDFRIHVAVDLHEIGPAVVVVVEKSTAPGDVTVVDADTGREGDVGKSAVAVVAIEIASIVGEIGFENVE